MDRPRPKLVCFFFEDGDKHIVVGEMARIQPMWTKDTVDLAVVTGLVESVNPDGSFETFACSWKPLTP